MINRRKVGMTSSHHGPYGLGYTRATMVGTEGCEAAMWSQSQKADRSPDCSLQLDCMKSESLVIANQNVAVNTFPGLVHTAVAPWELVAPEVGSLTFGRALTTVWSMTGVKS